MPLGETTPPYTKFKRIKTPSKKSKQALVLKSSSFGNVRYYDKP